VEESKYQNFEIPGVGEIKAREGTSSFELAGAVKYWHDRYQREVVSVRQAAFIAGGVLASLVYLIGSSIYWLW
jgi:hypothetical protein